ncbi:MAG TPA: amidohydrolase family protein [Sphingobium sp.]
MSATYDLVLRGGTIYDGTGDNPFVADIAISNGIIAEIGRHIAPGSTEIDAEGLMITPGFVDIHTHYDGQVTWEDSTAPSSVHGVTTVVMGNCGVGFAPCRAEDRSRLIRLMEGVEDIPEIVMTEGLPWNWETFPEYLDCVAARSRDIDVAAQLPHSCLRIFVMGERGARREPATAEDLDKMREIAREAMTAGAIGFGTSRTIFHRDSDGNAIPTHQAMETELLAVASGMAEAGHGVLQAVIDLDSDAHVTSEVTMLKNVVEGSGRPASFSLAQLRDAPDAYRHALDIVSQANQQGLAMKAQVFGRPTGILVGLDLSYNFFSRHPTYRNIAHQPLAERVAHMRRPEVRAAILAEQPTGEGMVHLDYLGEFDRIFALAETPDYEPGPADTLAARAQSAGVSAQEYAYDALLEDEGRAVFLIAFANFADGTLDAPLAMLKHEHSLYGLGDGGAHYGMICDAGFPTFMLTHWTRDRAKGEKLPIAEVVRGLAHKPAQAVGLQDRGLIAQGYKADINIIDYDALRLYRPEVLYDLPAGGRRLVQRADGYRWTIVAGKPILKDGVPTGEKPGRLVRGPQPVPAVPLTVAAE